ncbi:MAG: hypothetical protein A2070_03180 [Bdellovibrionales bacterium GWC1_52_8]|nr:MAG: hypothetical protein A2Z97_12075 [Bdellovibrionales bacterium GWB1_52_6]OFZ06031.1 MAG: hypothetical protein A2X97_01700 [Bdellovibrionales bacterium GWA1_52_35]OFZ41036.1 MAG: hypothetical protein A2070_03180 [Bdellovibrionales bacterium GWC1_52_8]
MVQILLLLAGFLTHPFAGIANAAPIPPSGFPDLVENTLPCVVNISSSTVVSNRIAGMEDYLQFWGIPLERRQTQTSLGSGLIIDADGFILTNNHVVDQATEVLVTLFDKRQFKAKIIGKDQKMDLALLQIRTAERKPPPDLKPAPLGNSDQVRIAETVFAVGNPFGLQHTVTIGIISAKNRTIGQGPFDNFLQTDASINPGNSGGPLFNSKGEAIGINTVIYSRTGQSGGLGFAIPVNEAKNILADLKQFGRVPRPWLGVMSDRMTPQIAMHFGLAADKGVLVYNIVEGAPADLAGFQQGDVIIAVNTTPVSEPNEVERVLSKFKPRAKATISVVRGRKKMDIEVKLGELPKLDKLPPGII